LKSEHGAYPQSEKVGGRRRESSLVEKVKKTWGNVTSPSLKEERISEWVVRVLKCHREAEENENQDKAIHCIEQHSIKQPVEFFVLKLNEKCKILINSEIKHTCK
jgi:hypothetical protein